MPETKAFYDALFLIHPPIHTLIDHNFMLGLLIDQLGLFTVHKKLDQSCTHYWNSTGCPWRLFCGEVVRAFIPCSGFWYVVDGWISIGLLSHPANA